MPDDIDWLTILVVVVAFIAGYLLLSWIIRKLSPHNRDRYDADSSRPSDPDHTRSDDKPDDHTAGPTWR